MKYFGLKYIGIVILLATLALASCNIREDMSNCPGTFLLDYTAYSDQILDEIDPESIVNVYVFDTKDICSDIISFSYADLKKWNYEFEVPRNYNGRNVLVWQGNDSKDYDATSMKIGETLDNFYLRLRKDNTNHLCHAPSLLWSGMLEPVEFCKSITRHRIFMTRIHTEINVMLDIKLSDGSIQPADMTQYEVNINSTDNVYHRDYTLCEQCVEVIYDNSEEIAAAQCSDCGHAGALRLSPNRTAELRLINRAMGGSITIGNSDKIDLVKYMLESRGTKATEDIDDQRFLDLNKKWDIKLVVDKAFVAISMTINGWTVWFDDTDLQ